MSTSVFLLLLVMCMQFATSVQQRNKLKRKLNRIELMIGTFKLDIQFEISELRETVTELRGDVEGIRNNSEVTYESESDAGAIASMRADIDKQRATVTALHNAFTMEKQHIRDRMNTIDELMNRIESMIGTFKLDTQFELSEIMAELNETKDDMERNTKQIDELKDQVEANKVDILKLRETQIQRKIKDIQPSSTIEPTITTHPTTTGPSTSTQVRVGLTACPEGWSKFQNKCYLWVKERVGWDLAQIGCDDWDASLAEPDTREKIQYLWQIATEKHLWDNYNNMYIWLGGTDLVKEGTWVWNDSGRPIVSSESVWVPGQPDSLNGNQDCLMMDKRGWRDMQCSFSQIPYVCEIQAIILQ